VGGVRGYPRGGAQSMHSTSRRREELRKQGLCTVGRAQTCFAVGPCARMHGCRAADKDIVAWQHTNMPQVHCYERPPVNKSPGVGGPRGAPRRGGGRYQHFEEIVGALRAQLLSARIHAYCFHKIWDVSRIGRLEIGGARVRPEAGVNQLRSQIGGNSLGEGGGS
jgi:hypothetical protein